MNKYYLFINYKGFGITEDDKYKYAYMKVDKSSYYVSKNNKLINSSGSTTLYKFFFDKKDNKVLKYQIPEDGEDYIQSIKNLFPDEIEQDAINYNFDYDKIEEEVKKYYSFLDDTNIYYSEDD